MKNLKSFIIIGLFVLVCGGIIITAQVSNVQVFNPLELGSVMEYSLDNVLINYKDDNMTIEFKDGLEVIGEATLKSHTTYDEIKKVVIGENRTVIWYEFSDFEDIQLDALKGVEFIDMKEMIENKSYIKQFDGDFEKMNKSLIIIKNPNYLLQIEKDYKFVYLNNGEWMDYNLKDIPKENIIIGVQTDLGWGEFLDVRLNILDNELDRHAVVIGTNAGFVTEAPEVDPANYDIRADDRAITMKDTSPANATKITEMGWWSSFATEEANFEVGLYSDDETGEPNLLLESSRTNAKGTTEGWKRVTGLNWVINSETPYWLSIQLDDTATQSEFDYNTGTGTGMGFKNSQITLPSNWGTSDYKNTNGIIAIYVVWEAGVSDTCTYTSGNWAVDCSDNCEITSNVNLGGNDISIIGTGTFTMNNANITNYGNSHIKGTDSSNKCIVRCLNGGCFKY